MSNEKAYLLEIQSEELSYKKNHYYHVGIYSYNNLFYAIPLNLDSTIKHPTLEGQVIDVFFQCSVIKDKPLTVIFEPVFIHPLITDNLVEYSKTKTEAFKLTVQRIVELITSKYSDQEVRDKWLNLYNNKLLNKFIAKIEKENPPCCGKALVTDNFYQLVPNLFTL